MLAGSMAGREAFDGFSLFNSHKSPIFAPYNGGFFYSCMEILNLDDFAHFI